MFLVAVIRRGGAAVWPVAAATTRHATTFLRFPTRSAAAWVSRHQVLNRRTKAAWKKLQHTAKGRPRERILSWAVGLHVMAQQSITVRRSADSQRVRQRAAVS